MFLFCSMSMTAQHDCLKFVKLSLTVAVLLIYLRGKRITNNPYRYFKMATPYFSASKIMISIGRF
jgi:cytochrome bd-type quinol oxidase subunit 1